MPASIVCVQPADILGEIANLVERIPDRQLNFLLGCARGKIHQYAQNVRMSIAELNVVADCRRRLRDCNLAQRQQDKDAKPPACRAQAWTSLKELSRFGSFS